MSLTPTERASSLDYVNPLNQVQCELRAPDGHSHFLSVRIEQSVILVGLYQLLQALPLHPFPVLPAEPPRNASRRQKDAVYVESAQLEGEWNKKQWRMHGDLLQMATSAKLCCRRTDKVGQWDNGADRYNIYIVTRDDYVVLTEVRDWLLIQCESLGHYDFDALFGTIKEHIAAHAREIAEHAESLKRRCEELVQQMGSI